MVPWRGFLAETAGFGVFFLDFLGKSLILAGMSSEPRVIGFILFVLCFVPNLGAQGSSLDILALRERKFTGGAFVVDQNLPNGTNYRQQIVSYLSEGIKIYGLLTIPLGLQPAKGFPAVVFVHGYIPPAQYSTTKSYAGYQATLARSGFITFKPDLRGHGRSEGSGNAHFSEVFTLDVLSAISFLKNTPEVDPGRIGYWGHSNGGETGLRVLVITQDIKAASLWAGVVGSYQDMLETWNAKIRFMRVPNAFTILHGLPKDNPDFYRGIEPHRFLDFIQAPVEIQHAQGDISVPVELSRSLNTALKAAGKTVTYYEYTGDDHNISKNYMQAWNRTIEFFRENL